MQREEILRAKPAFFRALPSTINRENRAGLRGGDLKPCVHSGSVRRQRAAPASLMPGLLHGAPMRIRAGNPREPKHDPNRAHPQGFVAPRPLTATEIGSGRPLTRWANCHNVNFTHSRLKPNAAPGDRLSDLICERVAHELDPHFFCSRLHARLCITVAVDLAQGQEAGITGIPHPFRGESPQPMSANNGQIPSRSSDV